MRHFIIAGLCFMLSMCSCCSLQAQSIGGITSGAATYCTSVNSGFLSLTGYTGSILNWESTTDGGATWTNIGNTTPAQSYFNLSITTCYRAIVQSGAFPPDTSTVSCITIYAPSSGGSISGGGTFCGSSGSGTLTLSGNTGGVTNWQFSTDGGATWTTVSDTNTFLNYPSLSVTTTYSAVVQNAACPVDTSSFSTITIAVPSVGGSTGSDDTVCANANAGVINLSGNTGSITGWISSTDGGLTWIPIPGTSTALPYSALSQTTLFAAVVQNATCPPDTSSFTTITVIPLPAVSAGADTTILPGQSVVLNGSGSGVPLWTPSAGLDSSNVFNPVATPVSTITYVLTVINSNGCSSSDAITVNVVTTEFNDMITTMFTPNGDGINDTWFIRNIQNYPDSEVMVYNIYGQNVYSQKNYLNDWKGTYNGAPLPDGTYYYVLRFEKSDKVFKGSLDILRNK
ncbi:MAG: gliding motility-associated C-terminal domain-containing protein [Bacteroidia bacterium]